MSVCVYNCNFVPNLIVFCVSKSRETMVENVSALGLLKEEMQSDEIHLKVNAIHRLKTVILSIGPNETKEQLIPYLQSKTLFELSQ